MCLGVHRDVSVFDGKGKEISASVLVILSEHKCQPLETPKNLGLPSDTDCHSPKCKKRCTQAASTVEDFARNVRFRATKNYFMVSELVHTIPN